MRSLEDLCHISRPLKSGGEILVIDTGALIDPENQAMIMARFSRFIGGSRALIADMFDRDAGKFLRDNYQAGYGHKSIAELGDTAIGIDGVSMLCAKAIQDFPLYRGQESSTRYINFSKQGFENPARYPNDVLGNEILEGWRSFYLEGFDVVKTGLLQRFPKPADKTDAEYKRAINAAAFDVMRSFLPAGAQTNVAWVGDLRHINDHLLSLRNHALAEVREVAFAIESALAEKFPNSFDPKKRYPDTEAYVQTEMANWNYYDHPDCPDFGLDRDSLDYDLLASDHYRHALESRPERAELPFAIRECGTLRFRFPLDFASFRDLQRQRAVTTRMPLLSARFGFESWYLDQLPDDLARRASLLITEQVHKIEKLGLDRFDRQYYLPMGMRCPIRMTGDLRALVYLAELRSSRHVHPTLRKRAFQTADVLMEKCHSFGMKLYLDLEEDFFDISRGTHDIIKKA